MEKILRLKAESVAVATSILRQPQPQSTTYSPNIFERAGTNAYMDECEQQLLRESQSTSSSPSFSLPSSQPQQQEHFNQQLKTPSTAQPQPFSLMEALQSSLESGKFSDLTIVHTTKRWSAHKVVVCSQSPILEARIETQNNENFIYLNEQDFDATCLMMEYLYTSNYTTTDIAPDFSLPLHIKVFCLASTLSIPGLQDLSITKFRFNLNSHVSDPTVFFTCVRDIYATTTLSNTGLRLAVVEAAITEMNLLLSDAKNIRSDFFQLTNDVPDFQSEIYKMLTMHPTRPVEVVAQELCEECGPRDADDGYEVTTECKVCGEERTLKFY